MNKFRRAMIKKSLITLLIMGLVALLILFITKSIILSYEVRNLTSINVELVNSLSSLESKMDDIAGNLDSNNHEIASLANSVWLLEAQLSDITAFVEAQEKEESTEAKDISPEVTTIVETTIAPFDIKDLRVPSNVTADSLNKHLEGRGLEGMGQAYVDAEAKYGVNAYYIASLTIWESAWGESQLAKKKNNLAGYGAYNESLQLAYSFESYDKCIDYVAKKIKSNYLSSSGKFFKGYGLEDINKSYAVLADGSPNWEWSAGIIAVMRQLSKS